VDSRASAPACSGSAWTSLSSGGARAGTFLPGAGTLPPMDDHPTGDAEVPAEPVDPGPPGLGGFVPPPLMGPAADALAAERAELRQRIDAGAGTPEELRALAAQMREVRQREELLWRQEVRPALVKARKGRLRPADLGAAPSTAEPGARSLGLGLAILGAVVAVLLLATQSSALWVLVPTVGVLVYAWRLGRRDTHDDASSGP
jgi:hypothetical protein